MRRGTTPIITFNTDLDFTDMSKLYVTFFSRRKGNS